MSDDRHDLLDRTIEEWTLDPYSALGPRFVVIVDADALLSSIDNHCRTGRKPRLLRMAESAASLVYAADHVYSETYRRFPKLAATSSASADEMAACFEEHYLPALRWVGTDGAGVTDERVALVIDETDVPTAQLASLVAPCLVLSEDKALRRPGFAPTEWRVAAKHAVRVIDGVGMQEAAGATLALPAVALVGGGVKLGQTLRLPWWASTLMLGAGGYVLLRNPQRRATLADVASRFGELVLGMMLEADTRVTTGAKALKPMLCESVLPPTIKQQVATVLARSPEPLLATEVRDAVERSFDDRNTPGVPEVRAILAASMEFTQAGRHRWQLGRFLGPP